MAGLDTLKTKLPSSSETCQLLNIKAYEEMKYAIYVRNEKWRLYLPIWKLLGCNNLVYYKVATSLKTPWICNVYKVATNLKTPWICNICNLVATLQSCGNLEISIWVFASKCTPRYIMYLLNLNLQPIN